MQKTVYTCDHDGVTIGEKKHVSLSFGPHSGIAYPPNAIAGIATWSVHHKLQGRFLHFCDEKCVAAFFKKLLNRAKA